MITLATGAILMVVAVPSYNGFITGQRVKTASYELYTSLSYARSEALKRNGQVFIMPGGGVWTNGWIVTTNGARTYNECNANPLPADCLRVQAPLPQVSITDGPAQVTYQRDGRASNPSPTFTLCSADGSAGSMRRRIVIDLTGRPNINRDGSCP
jgi:type IV fimbrial biogenesis protein FimT